jgi:hypothetical protein
MTVVIHTYVEIIGRSCFHNYKALTFVKANSRTREKKIEVSAFQQTDLIEFVILVSIETICEHAFADYKSLIYVSIESMSRF